MKAVPLTAFPRVLSRRGGSKKLRENGRIPAVIYGAKIQSKNLEFIRKDIDLLIKHSVSETLLIDLSIEGGEKHMALVQEVQHHPLSGKVLHMDFHEVSPTETVTITVPVETTGIPVGVKIGGGTLEHVLFKLKVRATPANLPELISVDVSGLDLNKTLHIGEITAPEGVEILGDKNIPVVTVAAPKVEVAAEPAADAAAAAAAPAAAKQPEMLKEKKEEAKAPAKKK
jgi:large subunit ribosomal protein L25